MIGVWNGEYYDGAFIIMVFSRKETMNGKSGMRLMGGLVTLSNVLPHAEMRMNSLHLKFVAKDKFSFFKL